jgi:hypothetical protein
MEEIIKILYKLLEKIEADGILPTFFRRLTLPCYQASKEN